MLLEALLLCSGLFREIGSVSDGVATLIRRERTNPVLRPRSVIASVPENSGIADEDDEKLENRRPLKMTDPKEPTDGEKEEVHFSCHQEASREPWTTETKRVAYVLRGEAFRVPGHRWKGVVDKTQWGPGHRATCSDGALEKQRETSEWHLKEVEYIESLGFNVTILGTTYPCSMENSAYTVQDELAKLYEGRLLHLNILDKQTSSQQVGMSDALRLVMEEVQRSEQAFEYVVVKRWDYADDVPRWGCHLQESLQRLQDLDALTGSATTSDGLLIVPRQQTPCFAEFLARPRDSISPCCSDDGCGGGGCQDCPKRFAAIMYNASWQRDQFQSCPQPTDNKFLLVAHEDPDPYASLPIATRNCLEQKQKAAVDE